MAYSVAFSDSEVYMQSADAAQSPLVDRFYCIQCHVPIRSIYEVQRGLKKHKKHLKHTSECIKCMSISMISFS